MVKCSEGLSSVNFAVRGKELRIMLLSLLIVVVIHMHVCKQLFRVVDFRFGNTIHTFVAGEEALISF
jgi:hypothetical protein